MFAAAGAVLASLVKGRWPSEARTEGLFRLEMPLTEGRAFWRGPRGRHFSGGNPPISALAPFDKGACSVRILGAARTGDPALLRTSAGGMNPAPTNKFYVLGDRDGCGHAL